MPVHDWTRVGAGEFHDFHCGWGIAIRTALNKGLLPPDYYALVEQSAGEIGPDVISHSTNGNASNGTENPSAESKKTEGTGAAVQTAPPQTRFHGEAPIDFYTRKRRTIVIRHSSEDRNVALIEIVSPGNKSSRHALRSFLRKGVDALVQGIHLLLLDLHPPGSRDPQGMHGALWSEISDENFELPLDKCLTLASYSAGQPAQFFVEPIAVGDRLPDMPLYLEPEQYVLVPLESTYQEAWQGVPRKIQRVLEG